MLNEPVTERRLVDRIPAPDLIVKIKIPGKWFNCSGTAIDYNRHGLSLICKQPLPAKGHFFLTLEHGDLLIEGLVGILHNCRPMRKALETSEAAGGIEETAELNQGGFRCGVRFRPGSCHQFDCHKVRRALETLEARLIG